MSVTNDDSAVDTSEDVAATVDAPSDEVIDEKRSALEDSRAEVARLEQEAAARSAAELNVITGQRIDREQAATDARIRELRAAAGQKVEPPKEAFGAPLTVQEQAEKDGKYFDPETGLVHDEKPSESVPESSSDPEKTDEEIVAEKAEADRIAAEQANKANQAGDNTDNTADQNPQTVTPPNTGILGRFGGGN